MKITINGIPPFDGDYPIDVDRLTNRDLHHVKRIAGVRPLELEDALDAGDMDVVVALAYVAITKNGHQYARQAEDALWNAELGQITVDLSDEDEGEGGVTADPPPPSGPDTPSTRSGSVSSDVSELHPENPPLPTGHPGSEQSASVRMISGT